MLGIQFDNRQRMILAVQEYVNEGSWRLRTLLRQINMWDEEALLNFNLVPLSTRRHIAMLGVLRRAALRLQSSYFWQWAEFVTSILRQSNRIQRNSVRPLLEIPDTLRTKMSRHSLFGVIKV